MQPNGIFHHTNAVDSWTEFVSRVILICSFCRYLSLQFLTAFIQFPTYSFGALTLLAGRQEGHPECINRLAGCWCGCLSGARCRLAYDPADATATLASVKSRLVLPFWYRLTLVVPDKGPLNGCLFLTAFFVEVERC